MDIFKNRYQGGFWKFHWRKLNMRIDWLIDDIVEDRRRKGKGKIQLRYYVWAFFFLLGYALG